MDKKKENKKFLFTFQHTSFADMLYVMGEFTIASKLQEY